MDELDRIEQLLKCLQGQQELTGPLLNSPDGDLFMGHGWLKTLSLLTESGDVITGKVRGQLLACYAIIATVPTLLETMRKLQDERDEYHRFLTDPDAVDEAIYNMIDHTKTVSQSFPATLMPERIREPFIFDTEE